MDADLVVVEAVNLVAPAVATVAVLAVATDAQVAVTVHLVSTCN